MNLTERQWTLRRPFPVTDVSWKPQVTNSEKTSAMVVTYLDPRAVVERLDEVFDLNWTSAFRTVEATPEKFVVECTITVLIGQQSIMRSDVGTSDNGAREADRHKSAYSDALKRAGVQFGIGAYLYDLPKTWVSYDKDRRAIKPEGLETLRRVYSEAVAEWTRSYPGPLNAERAARLHEALVSRGLDAGMIPAHIETVTGRKQSTLVGLTEAEGRALLAALGGSRGEA